MSRYRSLPWMHRYYRSTIAGIASIGAVGTGYLTLVQLTRVQLACPTDGCDLVLSSPYATVFGLPLSLFGFLSYLSTIALAIAPLCFASSEDKPLRANLEQWTGLLLFFNGTIMLVFSSYLMYLLAFVIKTVCFYCIASAFFSASIFVLSICGRYWEDIGQLLFGGIILAIVVLVATLGIYSDQYIVSESNTAKIALARYLTRSDAKMYGAFSCSYCQDQKELFGQKAFSQIEYIECDLKGKNPRPNLCKTANIQAFPTWQIDDELYQGVRSLEELADLSGYIGDRNF